MLSKKVVCSLGASCSFRWS